MGNEQHLDGIDAASIAAAAATGLSVSPSTEPYVDPTATAPLKATFTSAFVFEEPIALTMNAEGTGASKSRWLVTDQPGPAFALRAQRSLGLASTR